MDLLVQDVPGPVLRKLVADAKRRDVSTHEAAVSALADRYSIPRVPTGVKFRGAPQRTTLLLTLPDDLHQQIKMEAARERGATMRALIIKALAERYGVKVPAVKRRPRTVTTRRGRNPA